MWVWVGHKGEAPAGEGRGFVVEGEVVSPQSSVISRRSWVLESLTVDCELRISRQSSVVSPQSLVLSRWSWASGRLTVDCGLRTMDCCGFSARMGSGVRGSVLSRQSSVLGRWSSVVDLGVFDCGLRTADYGLLWFQRPNGLWYNFWGNLTTFTIPPGLR